MLLIEAAINDLMDISVEATKQCGGNLAKRDLLADGKLADLIDAVRMMLGAAKAAKIAVTIVAASEVSPNFQGDSQFVNELVQVINLLITSILPCTLDSH